MIVRYLVYTSRILYCMRYIYIQRQEDLLRISHRYLSVVECRLVDVHEEEETLNNKLIVLD